MITHPEPQIQAIFTMLEDQRDIAVVKAAQLTAEVKSLTKQLEDAAERIATAEAALEKAKPPTDLPPQ